MTTTAAISTYSDDWDAFIAKINAYDRDKRAALIRDGRIDGKLAMIHALSAEWRHNHSRRDAAARLRAAQARILEERRLTPDPDALRPYVGADTRALMPSIKITTRTPEQRRNDRITARHFWRQIEDGHWRGRSIEQIVERIKTGRVIPSERLLALMDRRGPKPTLEEINAHFATLRVLRDRSVPRARPAIDPAGMTPERALAIAIAVLNR